MHLPPEKPATQSHELRLPISEEGTRLEPEEIERSMEDLVRKQKAKIQSQKVDIFKLRNSRKRYERKYRGVREQVAELEHKVGTASKAQEDTLEWKERRFRTIEDELRRAKELLAARSAELSTAQSFLPTADQLSETAVLGIVRDLNKNICQVAIDLTGELEKLMTSSSGRFFIPKKKIEGFSQLYGPVLVLHSLEGDPGVVELLIMSCICMTVTQITSSWRDDDLDTELDQLGSVYKRLSASEEQKISARWRSLTHSHLDNPSSHDSPSGIITQHVAKAIFITGSFSTIRHSCDFVKAKASSGIETIERLARRLESAFMVGITSCDMFLLFGTPSTVFDERKMTEEFQDGPPARRRQDKVAGTTEVGVWRTVGGRQGQGRRTEILLKARVVLERDVTGVETDSASSCILA